MLSAMIQIRCASFVLALAAALLVGIVLGASAVKKKASRSRSPKGPDKGKEKPRDQGRDVVNRAGVVELYVGNLSYDVNGKELKKIFGEFGTVVSARIIENRFNGKSKGYGFVEMADSKSADAAIKAMNAKDCKGRKMVVNEAKSQARDD